MKSKQVLSYPRHRRGLDLPIFGTRSLVTSSNARRRHKHELSILP